MSFGFTKSDELEDSNSYVKHYDWFFSVKNNNMSSLCMMRNSASCLPGDELEDSNSYVKHYDCFFC